SQFLRMSAAKELGGSLAGEDASAEEPLLTLDAVSFGMRIRRLRECGCSEWQKQKNAPQHRRVEATARGAAFH
ncbi:MAG: hypothetical protein WAN70_02155, partial [Terriglobales bacterium]